MRRIKNCAWLVVGLIQMHSVPLGEVAQHIPNIPSEIQAPGWIAQVCRRHTNIFIKVAEFYRPLIT